MQILLLPFHRRFVMYTLSIVLSVLFIALILSNRSLLPALSIPTAVFIGLAALGTADLIQTRHAVLRNYPISAHLRFLLESIRPEMRQYFFEDDKFGMPFSRDKRALATDQFRITIGGPDCPKPYSASVFNISAMSFGALSPNALRALNGGAKKGGFAHDTGEGGVSPYHRENGGDRIWEIGSGYFGCRNRDGSFNPEEFARVATDDQIKMVELKISQGAKPGHGGVLPAAKVSEEISK